jgi:peptidoglycan/LPS O-acetylase OafA/YrhL
VLGFYFLLFILFVNHKLGFIVSKPTLFFGKISFALYLIHQFISIDLIIPELLKLGCPFWPAVFAALSISVVLATGITYFIEIPLGKKLNLALRRRLHLPLKHT